MGPVTSYVRQGQGLQSHGVTLRQGQLYSGTSRIEGLYYRMFQFHNVCAWKEAYHFSADQSRFCSLVW